MTRVPPAAGSWAPWPSVYMCPPGPPGQLGPGALGCGDPRAFGRGLLGPLAQCLHASTRAPGPAWLGPWGVVTRVSRGHFGVHASRCVPPVGPGRGLLGLCAQCPPGPWASVAPGPWGVETRVSRGHLGLHASRSVNASGGPWPRARGPLCPVSTPAPGPAWSRGLGAWRLAFPGATLGVHASRTCLRGASGRGPQGPLRFRRGLASSRCTALYSRACPGFYTWPFFPWPVGAGARHRGAVGPWALPRGYARE